jgi:hypothetical protein
MLTKKPSLLFATLALAACHDRPQVIAVQGGDAMSRPGQMTVTGRATRSRA